MKARYNIACNLTREDVRVLAFYTISSCMGILPSLSSKASILPLSSLAMSNNDYFERS